MSRKRPSLLYVASYDVLDVSGRKILSVEFSAPTKRLEACAHAAYVLGVTPTAERVVLVNSRGGARRSFNLRTLAAFIEAHVGGDAILSNVREFFPSLYAAIGWPTESTLLRRAKKERAFERSAG